MQNNVPPQPPITGEARYYRADQLSPLSWRETMSQFASGVTVVTTLDEQGQPVGSTVSAFSSLSLAPMLLLVCLDNRSQTLVQIQRQQRFAVNILSQQQQSQAAQFAAKGKSRFTPSEYYLGEQGMPLLHNACSSIECELHNLFDGGDHQIIVGSPLTVVTALQQLPLFYHRGAFV